MVCFACGASIQVNQREQLPVKTVLPPPMADRARRSEIDKRASFGERTTVTFQNFAEKDWGEKSGPNSRRGANWRSGAVALAGIALTCALAASAFVLSREKPTRTPTQSRSKEQASLPSSLTIAEGFLFASSPEERLQWVRDPEKHEAAIRRHFDAFGPETAANASLGEQALIEEEDGIISSFRAVLADGKSRLICVLDETVFGRRVVDWEAFARSGTASWDALLSGQAASAEVRVFVRPLGPGIFSHGDQAKPHYRYALTSPDVDFELHGFVERGTRTGLTLATALAGTDQPLLLSTNERMTLEVMSLGESYRERQFLIRRVIAKGWVKTVTDLEKRTILSIDTPPAASESELNQQRGITGDPSGGFIRGLKFD